MKTLGFALALAASCAAAPAGAGMFPAQFDRGDNVLVQPVADGDAPMPGHHRTRRGHGPSAKSVDPSIPSMKGVSQESADKAYKSKYGF